MTFSQATLLHKINHKTKPIGALGMLETIAYKIGTIQQTTSPKLLHPTIILFAGDHGIVKNHPVSPYPQEVTAQMVLNFINKGAAINVFCQTNQINLKVVDAGVNYDFNLDSPLLHHKIAYGTNDYTISNAMTKTACETAIQTGKNIITAHLKKTPTNIFGFGEMGIGNTSSAALIMSKITQLPLEVCTGKGTGLNNEQLSFKINTLQKALDLHKNATSPLEILSAVGGFEIAMMVGAYLEAYHQKLTIVVDGFIATSALLICNAMEPKIIENCLFSHCSNEQGHQKMLDYLNVTPILQLGLRLGEGTGSALAFPIIQNAVNFLNQMASFDEAQVSTKNL